MMSISIAGLFLGTALFIPLQAGPQNRFDLLPVWPPDGNVAAPAFHGKYVFRDPKTMEIVISYPNDANVPDGPRTIYRYRPQNQVDASVELQLNRDGNLLKYEYTVRNGPRARQPVELWTLVVPESAVDIELQQRDWAKVRLKGTKTKQAAFPALPAGDVVMWSSRSKLGIQISSGIKASGFVVRSTCLPGFTTAYLQGGPALNTNGDLPIPVAAQLAPFVNQEGANQALMTIGPRFDLATRNVVIAKYYIVGLEEATKSGVINRESPFYDKITGLLKRLMNSNWDGMADNTARDLVQIAETPFEKEIVSAIMLALR